ncbi:MAG: DUF4143 domain-containing protein [Coriobacteriia bacterium]|nr:DUF4143 domain-containing protein [Coriobacteriia bacterium]
MKNPDYMPRIIDKAITDNLKAFGAICIEGPKWCGKTWTSAFHSNSMIYIGDPTNSFQNRRLAEVSPELVLEGEIPRLIDEWQEVPPIWDAVRNAVDMNPQKGQYILTGSATPNRTGILHSGAGRIARLRMRPMSLYESGDSSGSVSLEELCNNILAPAMTGDVDLKKLIELIIRGGWPGSISLPLEQAMLLPRQYLDAIIADDVYRMDGIKRNSMKMQLLLRSLARNESTTSSNNTLRNDLKSNDDESIDQETVVEYLDIFKRLYLTENQPPFSVGLRSSIRVKQAEKRHLVDPSLACALLGVAPDALLKDLNTLGFLFEALCERDLRIYAESFGGRLYHYQDYKGREIDAVVELPDGRWSAFEIKLGANQIDVAAQNLLAIQDEMKHEQSNQPPIALCVICGMSNAAYKRADGVHVVPLTALKN